MFDCVISCDEIFQVTVPSEEGSELLQLVCRVSGLEEEEDKDEELDEEHDIDMPDCHRGRITAETSVYLSVEGSAQAFSLVNVVQKPASPPLANVVTICTSDEEGACDLLALAFLSDLIGPLVFLPFFLPSFCALF